MPLATKENSVDAGIPSESIGKRAEYKSSIGARPRVALAAKPLNSGVADTEPKGSAHGHSSLPQREPSVPVKRAASGGIGAQFDREDGKRYKVYEPISDASNDATDDDGNVTPPPKPLESMQVARSSTPYSPRSARRTQSDCPKPQSIEFDPLEFDFPATESSEISLIPDEDLLEGADVKRPHFTAPTYLPEFLRRVHDSMSMDLQDLEELDLSEAESEDPDESQLHLRIPESVQ